MKYGRTNKVGKFEVKKVKNKGAVSKNVVRVAISPRSLKGTKHVRKTSGYRFVLVDDGFTVD